MTIQNREAVDKYRNLLRCVEYAPEGTYTFASDVQGAVQSATCSMQGELRELDMDAGFGNDAILDIEASIYAHIKRCNPERADQFAVCEGFGEAMNGPAAERVRAQAARDRASLEAARQ